MKHFKNIEKLEQHLKRIDKLDLSDVFKIDGKIFNIVEYGEYKGNNYAIYYNKKTDTNLEIIYKLEKRTKEAITKDLFRFEKLEVY